MTHETKTTEEIPIKRTCREEKLKAKNLGIETDISSEIENADEVLQKN